MKYGNLTLGQIEALINKLGGEEQARAILQSDRKVVKVVFEDIISNIFDCIGSRHLARFFK